MKNNFPSEKDRELLQEARERLNWCATTESLNRSEMVDDLRFKVGLGHWPAKLKKRRERAGRPCEIINLVPGQIDLTMGELKQNKISAKILPTNKPATKKLADIIEGLIRNIEVQSAADIAIDTATEQMVDCGYGCLRIVEEYCDGDVFNKRLRIKRMKNQFAAYFDPSAEEWDKRDGRFAFVVEDISETEYKKRYPGHTPVNWPISGVGDKLKRWWYGEKTIRVAEYWVKVPKNKTYYLLSDLRVVLKEDWDKIKDELKAKEKIVYKDSEEMIQYADKEEDVPAEFQETMVVINECPTIKSEHTVPGHDVIQYIVDGGQVLSGPNKWKGRYIPIVPMYGKQTHIEGRDFIRGQIRNAKGPQRLYNYERNAEIERVAMAKVPTVVMTPEQLEDHEDSWSIESNSRVGVYNHVQGQAAPQFPAPPQASSGNIQQALAAVDDIKSTTSIFDATRGARSNETSGLAINARKSQSNIANFAYTDNRVRSARYMYEILLDMIPRTYTKERQEVILGADGVDKLVTINQVETDIKTGEEVIVNDITLGQYGVVVSVGPYYETQRMEFADKSIQLARFVPLVGQVGADLIVNSFGIHDSDKLSERIRRAMPPHITAEEGEEIEQEPPSADQIKDQLDVENKKLMNAGKQLDLQEKQLDIAEKGEQGNQKVRAAVEMGVQAALQMLNGE